MRPPLTSLLILGIGVWSGCGSAADAPPLKPVATLDQVMDGILAPASQVYWQSVSTIVSKEGIEERFPKTDEEWEAVWASAMTIAEAGNLLMMPTRAKDDGEWMRLSIAMVDVGVAAAKAAESKRPEAVLEMGEQVYNVCTECHMKYIVDEE